jgi:hypothetical protein
MLHEGSESEDDDSDNFAELPPQPDESEKTAHYFVFSGDNKAGMHGYEKV